MGASAGTTYAMACPVSCGTCTVPEPEPMPEPEPEPEPDLFANCQDFDAQFISAQGINGLTCSEWVGTDAQVYYQRQSLLGIDCSSPISDVAIGLIPSAFTGRSMAE